MSGATIQVNRIALKELKGELPKGKLGNHELSRLIMGGNLIGGWAHARDLIYAGPLFKAYNTEKKIFETLMLCEQAGVNCINIGFPTIQTMVKYKKATGSKIKVIVQVGLQEKSEDIFENVSKAVDNGMDIIQLQGNWCDWLVRDSRFDVIEKMMERIRSQGIVAGMGAHTIDSFIICEEKGIIPDYYMKTMHHDNYWSAHPRENRRPFEVDGKKSNDHNYFHDNCFCPFPDRTVEFVNRTKVPVMGFKVLAAGAIHPRDGFRWAFENGADFICVGMFDFQVVDDVNICLETLQNIKNRQRDWYA
jgi:phosphoheptose isomerase